MGFLNQLSEKLDSQQIYAGLAGKYETRFVVDGNEYALLANSVAGNGTEDYNNWMLEFENTLAHRIGMSETNPKIAKAFAEAVDIFIKEKNPYSFYTYGSHIESLTSIIGAIKKKVKKYNIIDDTADKKNEENGDVIEGNPIGKIQWTKMLEQEVATHDEIGTKKNDEFEIKYELPKDVKTQKAFLTGTSKSDKLDKKAEKSYDQKFESFSEFKNRKLGLVTEGLKFDEIVKKAKGVLKKFANKFKTEYDNAYTFATDKEKLLNWMEEHHADIVLAWDLINHMIDKKELSFEEEVLNGMQINESLLDTIAKKTPNAITAAALILTILSSGTKIFAQRSDGEDAFKKAKTNVEKIVDIVKEQGAKTNKDVKTNIDSGKEEVSKNIDKIKSKSNEIGQKVKKAGDDIGSDIKKGTENISKTVDTDWQKAKEKIGLGVDKIKDKSGFAKDKIKSMFKPKNKPVQNQNLSPKTFDI